MPPLWYSRYLAAARLCCRPSSVSKRLAIPPLQFFHRRTINTAANVSRADTIVPLRKQLKEEAKRAKGQARNNRGQKNAAASNDWELTVGIEIHAQLNSETKLFSSSSTLPNELKKQVVRYKDKAYALCERRSTDIDNSRAKH